jgi:predicted alpha/beta hydrolase family esterase
MRLLIVHGFRAGIDAHWFPWLEVQANRDGFDVQRVVLPEPSAPEPTAWLDAVVAALGDDPEVAVVAHSLGCLTVVRALLATGARIRGAVFVSGFADPLPPLPQLDAYIRTGARVEDARIDRVHVIRSDDDTLVPVELTEAFAARLGAPVTVVPGGGHFLASQGCSRLPAALDALRAMSLL